MWEPRNTQRGPAATEGGARSPNSLAVVLPRPNRVRRTRSSALRSSAIPRGERPRPFGAVRRMKTRSHCVAARRGGEQRKRTRSAATTVNTIRQQYSVSPLDKGEASALAGADSDHAPVTEAWPEVAGVVGGSRSGRDGVVNAGDLPAADAGATALALAGVRAAIVAAKSGNADGAKGGRKAEASSEGFGENTAPAVPVTDKQGAEDLWQRYGAERGVWSEKMLAALETGVKGNKWFSLIDKVYAERTLGLAWAKVRSNAGACGVDGITVARFAKDSQTRLLAVKEQLMRSRYQPKPVRRVWIPKPGSAQKRPLGIPTVTDRVVQAALRMVIEPIFEREFAPASYGFRPGRSCRDALRRVDELLRSGHLHVVDVDIRGYFDTIPHERLMAAVQQRMADGRVLGLLEAFLKAGAMEGMEHWEPDEGTPQGGVISPLLANIYLNELDWLLERSDWAAVRYADDIVVLCRNAASARLALETVREWMSSAGLTLNESKSRVVDMGQPGSHFDYLGYRFWRGRGGGLKRFVRPRSRAKLRERLKPLTRRNRGESLETIVAAINLILRSWYAYFRHVSEGELEESDRWVRGRLRSIMRKRQGGRGRGRGRDHQRWGNGYFARLGLFCLEAARAEALASLRYGATC